jgi:hypothetical protein
MRLQKTKKHYSKKTTVLIITAVIALILIGTGFIYLYSNNKQADTPRQQGVVDYKPPTSDQIENGNSIKENTSSESIDNNPSNNSPSDKPSVQVSLTSANQNGSLYQIRFLIDTDSYNGTCELKLSKMSQNLIYTSEIQVNNKASTCKGFDVPVNSNSLTEGKWKVELNYSNPVQVGNLKTTIMVK